MQRPPRAQAWPIISAILRYALLIVLAILFLLPFYIIVRNGLSTDQDITSPHWTFFPSALHWENISELFDDPAVSFLQSMLNSLVIAVLQTAGQLFFSALAGYGLARIPNRWANAAFGAVLLTLMVPAAVTFVPTFVLVSFLGWLNTLQGIAVPLMFSGFTTLLFRQFFLGFPNELEEAGRVDGLGYWGVFWRIVIPNSRSIIVALGSLAFITSWNGFLWPLVIGSDPSAWTVQVALSNFLNSQVLNLHELFIGVALAILPLVVIFLFLQRYIAEGVSQSGIKG
jgi:multiple sugar transport system permease protein